MVRHGVSCIALAVLLMGCVKAAPLTSMDVLAPLSMPYNPELRPWTVNMPLDDPEVSPGADAGPDKPTQVHLSIAGTNALYVMWATGVGVTGNGTLERNELTESIVHYGTSAGNLDLTANGTAEVYDQIYTSSVPGANVTNALNYTSPVLHTVQLNNLKPNTTYYYQVGDGATMSETFNFRSLAAPGSQAYPQRIAFLADWGYSYNSSSTLDHVIESLSNTANPPAIFYIADFCYADTWLANGTATATATQSADGFEGPQSDTWQPVWDAWMRFIEPLVSKVPMIGGTGNHEIEQQYNSNGNYTIFASVQARWHVPKDSGSYFYHSENFGPVHSIFLSNYYDYTPGSAQWTWLWQDLHNVNRTATPWVFVSFHNPWYTTDSSFKQFEQMRVSLEPITYQYGVDAFFYGHVHSYERTAPMYNYLVDPCGAVHLTIGDAGNSEGLSGLTGPDAYPYTEPYYATNNGGCPNVTSNTRPNWLKSTPGNTTDHFSWYKQVLTFQGNGNSTGPAGKYPSGFCWEGQPIWSQYRESSFGHGTLDIMNTTHALWQWHRNQDSNDVIADEIYLIRNTSQCPQKLGAAAYTSGLAADVNLGTTPLNIQSAGR
ncbi:hypothetical protein WJX73_007209 [Symbiochloris irregularis]|uniref:Purple acid phosphatase n=1 Tax=Symbiochloris irregularis TaxID=706552 RepID=A0AAW1NTY8_9CHLO